MNSSAESTGKEKRFRLTLRRKINLLVAAGILITSLALLLVIYFVYSERVDEFYRLDASHAAENIVDILHPDVLEWFRERTGTDAFRSVRERAGAEQDPMIILDWMKSEPGAGRTEGATLLDDYQYLTDTIIATEKAFPLAHLFVSFARDGRLYTLVDPDTGLLSVGSPGPDTETFFSGGYRGTAYSVDTGWLFYTYKSFFPAGAGDGSVEFFSCAEVNTNEIGAQRSRFLYNSILLILLLTAVFIVLGMLIFNRVAVRPLRRLRQGVMDFARKKAPADAGSPYTMDDVMDLDIPNRDEIGDLYQDFRVMQTSIVRNTEEMRKITAEKERTRTELELAARIQASSLPSPVPDFTGDPAFDLSVSMAPAKAVGGDFYDFIRLDDRRLALVIADVSGKGVPAALFMMTARDRISLRAQAGGTPAEILADVNAQLCRNNQVKMFVTVWLGILDLETGVLTAANGGHPEPVLGSGGAFARVHDQRGLVLGGLQGIRYTDYEMKMRPGDVLFVYTDGIPEASRGDGEFYGYDRMLAALNAAPSAEPEALLAAVRQSVAAYMGDAEAFDDLTMLCLRYNGAAKN